MTATETSTLPDYAPVPVMESIRLDLGYGSRVHP